jgi:hypothetical protein
LDNKVILKSRSDLSKARTPQELKNAKESPGSFGNKGYYGLPLPLIPDIRSTEVKEGTVGKLLEAFGVKKKYDRQIELQKGPNKKANRYLIWQYTRLIKTLEGTKVKGTPDIPAHIV